MVRWKTVQICDDKHPVRRPLVSPWCFQEFYSITMGSAVTTQGF